jgi:heme/copper-type cytochrome/quinol oxidase subunit 2
MLSAEYGFAHPESFFDFTTSLVIVVGPLLASIASVVAIVQRRRGTLDRAPRSGEVRALQAVGACVVLLAVISGFLTVTQQATVVAAGDVTEVTLHDDRFRPHEFRVPAGDRVEFLLRNDDSYAHTFSIDALEVDEYVGPRSERIVAFAAEREGPYELYCAIIGHEDMVGTILVEPR